ncbi:MAG: alpha/beta hydrolase [Proteobacteria bacterium]|nr:alpha/beta hydrolase [Pseudomonadota bacterium]
MSEKGIVFFPERRLEATPKDYRLGSYEDVFFEAMDGTRLHGWFVDGPDNRAVLLWFHGNAGNISHRLHNLKKLHDALQIPIFIFDYREYGLSEGLISKKGTFSDAQGALRYLTDAKGFDKSSILLFGRSLGTALAVDIASKEKCLGVILEAAFTSTDDMMRRYFPFFQPRSTATVKYDSIALIDRITSPLLFIHGQFDFTIPKEMARQLYDKARAPKEFYEISGADHNDTYLVGGHEYFAVWQKFLINCLAR